MRSQKLLPGIFTALLLLCAAAPSFAQDPPETAPPLPEPAIEEVEEQPITVTAVPDEDIAHRLQEILETTGRYQDLTVRVENGVVFLEGQTVREEYKEWARSLALRTEDAVAVVNNLEVQSTPEALWDFEPALDQLRDIWRATLERLPLIVFALIILAVTIAVSRLAHRIAALFFRRRIQNAMLRGVLNNVVVIVVLILGLYLVLQVAGLTRLAVTMIGGTGILGLVIGFAFRDIAENFLASLLISIQKPFRIGDTIEVDGYLGIVQKVTTRGTVLMAYDGNYIQIANATVFKSTIRNFTSNPKMRLDFLVGVGYDADVEEAQALLLGVVQRHPAVYDDPEPRVFVENLGPSTIDLHVYFWINIVEFSQFKVRSSVMRQSVAELLKAGISMPDQFRERVFLQTLALQQPGERAESAERPDTGITAARRRAAEADAPAVTEAEGDLGSEVGELQAQADQAGLPEAGKDILS